jgi:hypothetical protein
MHFDTKYTINTTYFFRNWYFILYAGFNYVMYQLYDFMAEKTISMLLATHLQQYQLSIVANCHYIGICACNTPYWEQHMTYM